MSQPPVASVQPKVDVPTDDPFVHETFRAGMEAWRRPHTRGACANCHAPDGFDLARINYTDSVIIRRALGNEASLEDAQKIVAMVHWLRARWKITKPLDPTEFRPLQPGGSVLPGETYEQRDEALYDELQRHGLTVAQRARIDSTDAAKKALAEILATDLRTVRLGVPFNRWTEDAFRSEDHRTTNEWIPDVPAVPRDAAAWYRLHDAYIRNPTPANLWAYVDRASTDTHNKGFTSDQLARIQLKKYQSVQVMSHMMRFETSTYPDAVMLDDAAISLLKPGRPVEQLYTSVHQRVDLFWDIGATSRALNEKPNLLPSFMHDKLTSQVPGVDRPSVSDKWSWEVARQGLAWFWLGMIYEPSMQFSGGGNKDEYLYERMDNSGRSNCRSARSAGWEFRIHMEWLATLGFVHRHFGVDTRLGWNDPNTTTFGRNGDISRHHLASQISFCDDARMTFWNAKDGTLGGSAYGDPLDHATIKASGKTHLEKLRLLAANRIRMGLLLTKDHYASGVGKTKDANLTPCVKGAAAILAKLEAPEERGEIDKHVADVLALLAKVPESGERPRASSAEEARATAYFTPARFRPLPLVQSAASEGVPRADLSPWFFTKCAGCHGNKAEGRGAQYPALPGALTAAQFSNAVRAGRPEKGMPGFSVQSVSDAELEQLYRTLKDARP